MKDLEELCLYAKEHGVPIIRDRSACFLQEQVALKKPRRILEIGTAIGYSGTLMLHSCEKAELTTIEIDEKSYKKACQTFAEQDVSHRVNAILSDAKDILEKLVSCNEKFDFIFLDGPKGQYVYYLPYLKQLLNKSGVIFADNVYLHGMVLSNLPIKHKHRTMVRNMREYLKAVQNDKDLITTIYDIEDGIAVSIKL